MEMTGHVWIIADMTFHGFSIVIKLIMGHNELLLVIFWKLIDYK